MRPSELNSSWSGSYAKPVPSKAQFTRFAGQSLERDDQFISVRARSQTPEEAETTFRKAFWELVEICFSPDKITPDADLAELESGLSEKERFKPILKAGIELLEEAEGMISFALFSGEELDNTQREEVGMKLLMGGALVEDHISIFLRPEHQRWENKRSDLGWYMQKCGRDLMDPDQRLEEIYNRLKHWVPRKKELWNISTYKADIKPSLPG